MGMSIEQFIVKMCYVGKKAKQEGRSSDAYVYFENAIDQAEMFCLSMPSQENYIF